MSKLSKGISTSDLYQYRSVLRQIKVRMAYAVRLPLPRNEWWLEAAALQMRKTLELIVLGSLVTNRQAVEQVSTAFHRRDADGARKLVRQVNPRYWPVPTRQIEEGEGRFRLEDVSEGFLREEEWGREYGFLSELLHAENPFKDESPMGPQFERIEGLMQRTKALLNHHWIYLADEEVAVVAMMQTRETGDVQVVRFDRL